MRDFIEVLVKLNNFATRQLVITLIISVRTMLLVVNYMYFCFASVTCKLHGGASDLLTTCLAGS